MPSPNFDAMSVNLSKKLGDPVSAAANDGKVWTSALRTVLLNNAHRKWMFKELAAGNMNALQTYKSREGQALSNNAKALSGWTGGVMAILSAYNSTDGVIVNRLPDGYVGVARSSSNTYYTPSTTNQFWVVEAGSFILMDGGTTTGDTIVLEYVKPHTDLSAGGSTDTSVPAHYWHEVVEIAMAEGLEERSKPEDRALAQVKVQFVDKEIAMSPAVADK